MRSGLVTAMKLLDLHGDRVAWRDSGAGEALLLIHGVAGSSANWRMVLPVTSTPPPFIEWPRCALRAIQSGDF
jgi:pimeloyl-ACP methyl ester carboxylesterase